MNGHVAVYKSLCEKNPFPPPAPPEGALERIRDAFSNLVNMDLWDRAQERIHFDSIEEIVGIGEKYHRLTGFVVLGNAEYIFQVRKKYEFLRSSPGPI
jgi:hypothetical protein